MLGWLLCRPLLTGRRRRRRPRSLPVLQGGNASRSGDDEIAGLRQQVEAMQQRLQSQQAQLDQQAIQFQQLGGPAHRGAAEESARPARPPCKPRPTRRPAKRADPLRCITPPGIVFPFSRSAGPCYPRAILGGQYRLMFNAANYDYHPAVHQRQPAVPSIHQRASAHLADRANQRQRGGLRPGPDRTRSLGRRTTTCPRRLPPPERPTIRWA